MWVPQTRAMMAIHPKNHVFGVEITLVAKNHIQTAPTPPRASSIWSFGEELLQAELEPCQTDP